MGCEWLGWGGGGGPTRPVPRICPSLGGVLVVVVDTPLDLVRGPVPPVLTAGRVSGV